MQRQHAQQEVRKPHGAVNYTVLTGDIPPMHDISNAHQAELRFCLDHLSFCGLLFNYHPPEWNLMSAQERPRLGSKFRWAQWGGIDVAHYDDGEAGWVAGAALVSTRSCFRGAGAVYEQGNYPWAQIVEYLRICAPKWEFARPVRWLGSLL
jgi:hypothetical protein